MIRTAITSALVLSLALVTGCDKPVEGTTPPPDGSDETASTDDGGDKKGKKGKKGKKDDAAEGGGEEGGGEEADPTQTVCPAEVADYPAPYFSDTVLIRLPKNVSEDSFVEFTPTFARLSSPIESVSCVEGLPGAMISYMAMTYYEDDTAKDMMTLRNETLEVMGYKAYTASDEAVDEKARKYYAVLDVPGDDQKPEPARALFQMVAAHGIMYAVVYETHPNAWNALKETFKESATRMAFLPAGG